MGEAIWVEKKLELRELQESKMNVQTDARALDLKSAQKVIRKCIMNSSNSNNDNKSGDEIGIDLLDIPFIVIVQSD